MKVLVNRALVNRALVNRALVPGLPPDGPAELSDALLPLLGHPPQVQHRQAQDLLLVARRGTDAQRTRYEVPPQLWSIRMSPHVLMS
ncbi:hypothetical protein EYF80_055381 [Liparis tanakae]|uniref:Uncharacterized protein n=1 Tax=Liparis tanakae TaxID=230148 RepID=A0A4Z2F0H1_9TELE|nr:hypothetical protein EYF80_055381 [Liparis tanakae]